VASYNIRIKVSAARELEQIPKADRLRVISRIRSLADHPRGPATEKLSGAEKYRIRQGNYRVVYTIADQIVTVFIIQIGDRKDIYR
jgi:mRNA interferase RelE/StbE